MRQFAGRSGCAAKDTVAQSTHSHPTMQALGGRKKKLEHCRKSQHQYILNVHINPIHTCRLQFPPLMSGLNSSTRGAPCSISGECIIMLQLSCVYFYSGAVLHSAPQGDLGTHLQHWRLKRCLERS